jgi:hypothetical protein
VRSAVDLPKTATQNEMKEKMEVIYQNYNRGRAIIDSSYKSMLDNFTNKINRYSNVDIWTCTIINKLCGI